MEMKLIRVDYRLIHGQVVTKWVKQKSINRIILVNDELAKDDFLADVYEMAAPPGVKVEIYSIEAFLNKNNDNNLGGGNVLLLLKDVGTVLKLLEGGFEMDEIQIGGLGGQQGAVPIIAGISFSTEDAVILEKIRERGEKVYLNILPTEPVMQLDKALEKFYSKKGE